MRALTDFEVVEYYRRWSEGTACAGFLGLPKKGLPTAFLKFLETRTAAPQFEDYEQELIRRFREWEKKQ